jgi:hypothetical protein
MLDDEEETIVDPARRREVLNFAEDGEWRKSAENRGGPVHGYGMHCLYALLRRHMDAKNAGDLPKLRSTEYRPIPWERQYDMECWITFNWFNLWRLEVSTLEALVSQCNDPAKREALDARLNAVRVLGPTLLPRHEHLLRASEIRWPTVRDADGVWCGPAKRHAWPERLYRDLLDPAWDSVPIVGMFGGGGQGKTTMAASFMLHMHTHYIGTREGAQGIISTINMDKFRVATWPGVVRMHDSSDPGFSIYDGHARVTVGKIDRHAMNKAGGLDERRPDGGNAVIMGVMMRVDGSRLSGTDKITGAHGKEAKAYLMDEAQGSHAGPFSAITNMFTSTKRGRAFFMFSGNFATRGDTLGRNIKPLGGWDNALKEPVNEYRNVVETGQAARILYFNNLESPGMTNPEVFHDLFTESKLMDQTRGESADNPHVARMVRGWYDVEVGNDKGRSGEIAILTPTFLRENAADAEVDLQGPYDHIVVVDSAPQFQDRNVMLILRRGWVGGAGVFQPICHAELPKPEDMHGLAARYPSIFATWVKNTAASREVSHDGLVVLMDNHSHQILAPAFASLGMRPETMVYAANPGKRQGEKFDGSMNIEPWLPVGDDLTGFDVAKDRISLGAHLLREFVVSGQMKGLSVDAVKRGAVSRFNPEAEMFSRVMYRVRVKDRGSIDLWKLADKRVSDAGSVSSPDWLDLWIMSAYAAAKYWREVPRISSVRPEVADENDGAQVFHAPTGDLMQAVLSGEINFFS